MFGSAFTSATSPADATTTSNNEDTLNSTQSFLSETLSRTQREHQEMQASPAAAANRSPRMFQGITLKSLLMWEKPKESLAIAGTLLGFIVVFGIMEYTMLTFICRLLQLIFIAFAGANYLGKPLATSQEIVQYAQLLHEMFLPLVWETVDFLARIITWENRSTTTEVFIGTIILAALGNFFSDLTLVFLVTLAFFVVPVLYMKNKAVVDGHLETAKEFFDRLIAQSQDQLKSVAASLSPNSSPSRQQQQQGGAAAGSSSLETNPTAASLYGKEKTS